MHSLATWWSGHPSWRTRLILGCITAALLSTAQCTSCDNTTEPGDNTTESDNTTELGSGEELMHDSSVNCTTAISSSSVDNSLLTSPTATPIASPTATPTASPTATPTASPTATPTASPTATPTASPTAAAASTTSSMTTTDSSSSNNILGVLSDPPVYLGLAGGGLVIIIILLFACIGLCVLCSKRRGSSEKKKKKSGEESVHWTKEGEVQLVSFAEKAGVKEIDDNSSKPEAVQSQENPQAEDENDAKEDDNRVVTVATFGFPEVCIQPPASAAASEEELGPGECNKEAGKKDGKEEKTAAKPSSENSEAEHTVTVEPVIKSNAPETTDNSLKVEDAIVQTVQDTQVGAAEGGVQVAAGPVPSVEGTKVTAVVHQPVPTVTDLTSNPATNLDPPTELGIDSILSTEAIGRALGLDLSIDLDSTPL